MSLRPNLLCHADCLDFLERLESESAHLVYIDPPKLSESQFATEKDSEPLDRDERRGLEDNALSAYLDWISRVIQQALRVTATNGNVVVRSEPRTNSYLRVIAERTLRDGHITEIILRRPPPMNPKVRPVEFHETMLLCQVSGESTYNAPSRSFTADEVNDRFPHEDTQGRYSLVSLFSPASRPSFRYEWHGIQPPPHRSWRLSREKLASLEAEGRIHYSLVDKRPYQKAYFHESAGMPLGNTWDDLPLMPASRERQSYPSQRPVALMERVIAMTTNDSDTVVDPFCGTGTTLVAASQNSRRWLSCDNFDGAIEITKHRLEETVRLAADDYRFVSQEEISRTPHAGHVTYLRLSDGLVGVTPIRFKLNEPVELEETRHYEFKEVRGQNPVGAIANKADEYAVAFLNSEGGRIFWGIRDDRVTVGTLLRRDERDVLRQQVINKLHQIQPSLSPSTWRLELHPVYNGNVATPDLFVVELLVPRPPAGSLLHATSSGEVFIKTDSGKKRLSFSELQAEMRKRLSV